MITPKGFMGSQTEEEKMPRCKECNKNFPGRASLASHRGWHTKQKNLKRALGGKSVYAETQPQEVTKERSYYVIKTPDGRWIGKAGSISPVRIVRDVGGAKRFNDPRHLVNWMRAYKYELGNIPVNSTIKRVRLVYRYVAEEAEL
jgi:hypothetical protein